MSASSSSNRSGVVFNKTVKSALVLQVPEHLRAPVDAIRKDYDRSFGRWPPHVNLLYPFVEAATFTAAAALIEPILRQFEPFRVAFVEFGSFEHRGSTTVWLRPETEPPNVLERIHAALRVAFPHCDDLDTKSEHGYTPHMTIAQVKGHARASVVARLREQFQSSWQRLAFTVDTLYLLAREDDTPFVPYYDFPLGASASQVARAAARSSEQRLQARPTFRFNDASGQWLPVDVGAEQSHSSQLQLIVLRGPSGSGKSFAVREILAAAAPRGVSLSTDDFFTRSDGVYDFQVEKLPEAHEWNRARAFAAIDAGQSPIVIDNTNLEAWEAAPYVKRAVERGYAVDIRDSSTPWCRDAAELARRNAHGVPLDRIEQQLQRWTHYSVGDALAAAASGSKPTVAATTATTATAPAAATHHELSVLTYNVLLDSPDEAGRFDSAVLESDARVPCILEVIERSNADVVCLQEVTKPILACVLACGLVRERYYVSDAVGDTVVPYGQVTLAKRVFETSVLPLSSVKRVVAARMRVGAHTVLLCNVHFPSSVGKNGAARRHQQIGSLLSLAEQDSADHVLIVGDTNMEPGEEVTTFDDAWLALGRSDEQGFTFDPERNPTAKITSVRGLARRYDRVLFKSRRGSIAPVAGALAGVQTISPQHYQAARRALPLCPSDHFALAMTLAFSEAQRNRTQATLARVLEPHSYAHARVVIAAAKACAALLRAACGARGAQIAVVPYGSLALGIATAESDVDMLCVGTVPRAEFVAIAAAALTHAPHCRALRDVEDAVVPVFTARVAGVDIDIAYAQVKSGDVVASSDLVATLAAARRGGAESPFVSAEAARCAAGLLDAHLLQRDVDGPTLLNVFRPLARLVRAWARFHGIYTNRFGYIGGFGWCCVVMAVVRRRADASETLEQCARRFFRELATHEWGKAAVKTSEPVPTLAVMTPSGQFVARHSTRASRVLVERCFERAAQVVASDDIDWYELFTPLPARATVVFEVSVSAGSWRELRDWYAHVTNRLASFSERVLKACADDTHVVCLADERPYAADYRIDGPFAARHYVTLESHSRSLQLNMASLCAAWLQGLHSWSARKSSMVARIEQRAAVPPNAVPLRWTEVDNEDDDFSYHELEDKERIALISWHQSPTELADILKQMVRDLDHVVEQDDEHNADDDNDDDNDDNDDDGDASDEPAAPAAAAAAAVAKPKPKQKKRKGGKKKSEDEVEEEAKKTLRPAHIVYKHILYGGDAGIVASQFHVLWEDRHLGMVDQLLVEYDIENVPLHRVRRFERVLGDGVTREVVWDREKRIDTLKK